MTTNRNQYDPVKLAIDEVTSAVSALVAGGHMKLDAQEALVQALAGFADAVRDETLAEVEVARVPKR